MVKDTSKPTKVLLLITRLNNGGAAKHVVYLAKGLKEMGFYVSLTTGCTEENEDHILAYARQKGVEPVLLESLRRSLHPLRDFSAFVSVYRLLSKEKPHIIHTHMSKAGFIGRIAAILFNITHKRKIKIVHTFHGHIFHSYFTSLKTAFFKNLERLLAKKTDRLIAVSSGVKEQVQAKINQKNNEKFVVIPLGLDLPVSGNKLNPTQACKDGFIQIGMLGRIAPIKNYDLAVTISQLCDMKGIPVRIQVGGGGWEQDLLAYTASPSPGITFLGNVESPSAFWVSCNMALVTSKNEGTPVSLIEAMLHGLPFVAPFVGGIPDMAGGACQKKGNLHVFSNCILVEGFDPEDFIRAIDMYRDPQIREKSGKEAARFARDTYSMQLMLENYTMLYRKLIAG